MHTPSSDTLAGAPAPTAAPRAAAPTRRVTDAPTRLFHALFALCFLGAYLTADSEHWRRVHVTLGYALAGLLVFRVLYGTIGPRHARLGLLWRRLAGTPAWGRSLMAAWHQRAFATGAMRQGQNLLMALAMGALLLLALPVALSGYATYNDWGGHWLEELHEFLAEAMLMAVFAHLALLAGLSLLRGSNLARPMLNGRVDGRGPDLVPNDRRWLAAWLLLAVLGYFAWEGWHAPVGQALSGWLLP